MRAMRAEGAAASLEAEVLFAVVQGDGMAKADGIPKPFCLYCGFPAQVRDHVVPFSRQGNVYRQRKFNSHEGPIVDCCHACNVLLGAALHHKFSHRLMMLIAKYERRLGRSDVDYLWDEDELSTLGHGLRSRVQASIVHAQIVRAKLVWLRKLLSPMQE